MKAIPADLKEEKMSAIKSYHCNACGAWLLVGEAHTCNPERLATIARITEFLGNSGHEDESAQVWQELQQLMAQKPNSPPKSS
jgi:hypothetical protein